LYDEFEDYGINGYALNKMMLKYAKNHGNWWFRHFEDISIVAYFFGPCSIYKNAFKVIFL